MNKEQIFNENIPFAYYMAKKYKDKVNIEMDDLIQVCLIALWKAVGSFDCSKEYVFSTYAQKIILNDIRQILRKRRSKKRGEDNVFCKSLSEKIYKDITIEDTIADTAVCFEDVELEMLVSKIKSKLTTNNEIEVLEGLVRGERQIDIANRLGISRKKVFAIVMRIRRKLNVYFKSKWLRMD